MVKVKRKLKFVMNDKEKMKRYRDTTFLKSDLNDVSTNWAAKHGAGKKVGVVTSKSVQIIKGVKDSSNADRLK